MPANLLVNLIKTTNITNVEKFQQHSQLDKHKTVALNKADSFHQPANEPEHKNISDPNAGAKFKLTLEPMVILLYIGFNVSNMVKINMLEERMCLHTSLGKNKSVDCFNMTAAEQEIVQPAVANLQMMRNLIETLIPCGAALFLGPWSDVNGRVPLLLSAISGVAISSCMFCAFSTIPEMPPIMFLLCSLPLAMTGGTEIIYIVCFCYIVDITDYRTRAFRLSFLQTFKSTGSIIGAALSPIFYSKSATLSFAASSVSTIAGLLYTFIFIKETVVIKQGANSKLFNIDLLRNMWRAITERRTGFSRCIIILSSVALTLHLVIIFGEGSLLYMYLQKQFSWTLEKFTVLKVYETILHASIPPLGLYILSTKLQIHDMYLAVFAAGLRIIENIGFAYSMETWQFYTSNLFDCFVFAVEPLTRSQLSKLVPLADLGKIHTFISLVENVGIIISSPIYTTAYDMTIHHFANFIFFLSAIFSVIIFALFLLILFLLSKNTEIENTLKSDEEREK